VISALKFPEWIVEIEAVGATHPAPQRQPKWTSPTRQQLDLVYIAQLNRKFQNFHYANFKPCRMNTYGRGKANARRDGRAQIGSSVACATGI
jgi:hypothetical protein